MRFSRSSLLLALSASLALVDPARAYVRTVSGGKYKVFWSDPHSIKMTVLTGGETIVPADDLVAAATRAAATWSDPALESKVAITIERSSAAHVDTAYDMLSTISFKTDSWGGDNIHSSEQLALTTLWNKGGRIVDADTEINGVNAAYPWGTLPDDPAAAARFTSTVDLPAALTHELGHVVGLDHPCLLGAPVPGEKTNTGDAVPSCYDPALPASVRDATMYPSANPGEIGERTLSDDEKTALLDLYPLHSDSGGGCAIGAGTPPSRLAGLLGLAGALLVARRQRPRARR
jgi:hypothetical protein